MVEVGHAAIVGTRRRNLDSVAPHHLYAGVGPALPGIVEKHIALAATGLGHGDGSVLIDALRGVEEEHAPDEEREDDQQQDDGKDQRDKEDDKVDACRPHLGRAVGEPLHPRPRHEGCRHGCASIAEPRQEHERLPHHAHHEHGHRQPVGGAVVYEWLDAQHLGIGLRVRRRGALV